tara:strand:- start:2425 stop:3321 length:897 start_codon:yes stop_codon:yes gene_type:complete
MDAAERAYRKAAKSLPVVRRGRNVERFTDSEGKRRRFYKTPQGQDQRAISRKSKIDAAARIRQRSLERQAAEPPLTEAQELAREKRREEARKDRAALKAKRMEDALPGETYEEMRKRQAREKHDAFMAAQDKRKEKMISSGRLNPKRQQQLAARRAGKERKVSSIGFQAGGLAKVVITKGFSLAEDVFKAFRKAYNKEKNNYGLDGIVSEKAINAKNALALGHKTPGVDVNKFIKKGDPIGLLKAIKKQKGKTTYTPQRGELYTSTVPKKKRINPDTEKASGGKVYASSTRKAKYTAG